MGSPTGPSDFTLSDLKKVDITDLVSPISREGVR